MPKNEVCQFGGVRHLFTLCFILIQHAQDVIGVVVAATFGGWMRSNPLFRLGNSKHESFGVVSQSNELDWQLCIAAGNYPFYSFQSLSYAPKLRF